MDERVMQFRVGALIIGTVLIGGILLAVISEPTNMFPTTVFGASTYEIHIHFGQAPNVKRDTPVRKSGILIGRVSDIQLQNQGGVMVTVRLEKKYRIREDEVFVVSTELLGDAVIDVMPKKIKPEETGPAETRAGVLRPAAFQQTAGKESEGYIPEGATVEGKFFPPPGRVVQDLYQQLDAVSKEVNNASVALTGAGQSMKATADRLNNVLDEETQANMRKAAKEASESLTAIRTILGDKETQQSLQMALKDLPATIEALKGTLAQANNSLKKFSTPSGPDQKTPIDQMIGTIGMVEQTLREFTTPGRPGQPPPVDRLKSAMEELDTVAGNLAAFTNRLNREDTTLGRLLDDQEIYQHLNRAVRNIDELSRQLRPIVDDARVFTDKISRHPGVIVRDAVRPGPGVK